MFDRNLVWAAALAVALCGALGCSEGNKDGKDGAKDGTKDGKGNPVATKGSATPEEAVKVLLDAMKAGDIDAVMAALPKAHSDALRTEMAAGDELAAAYNELQAAADAKLAAKTKIGGRRSGREEFKQMSDALKSYTIGKAEAKGEGLAEVAVSLSMTFGKEPDARTREEKEKCLVLKEADGWKAVIPGMPQDASKLSNPARAKRNLDQLAAIRKATAKVNDGTLTDDRAIWMYMDEVQGYSPKDSSPKDSSPKGRPLPPKDGPAIKDAPAFKDDFRKDDGPKKDDRAGSPAK